jgi:hypothetical protein
LLANEQRAPRERLTLIRVFEELGRVAKLVENRRRRNLLVNQPTQLAVATAMEITP